MKNLFVGLMILTALSLGACSLLDQGFGVRPPGTNGPDDPGYADPDGGVVGGVGRLVGGIPGWGWLASFLTTVAVGAYQGVRMKRKATQEKASLGSVLESIVTGIDSGLEQGMKDSVAKDKLYELIQKQAKDRGVEELLKLLVAGIKAKARKS